MKLLTPVVRIAIGLVCLTMSILIAGNLLVNPLIKTEEDVYQSRQLLLESLAVQYSALAQRGQIDVIRAGLRTLVERNPDIVLSAALRLNNGRVLVETPQHRRYWKKPPGDQSTLAHPQVPILNGTQRWGTLEVSFAEAKQDRNEHLWQHPLLQFVAFTAVVGFLAYLYYMQRTLDYLDPSAVIPERVKAAYDALSEGIVLLDDRERIVLANAAFTRKSARPGASLLGLKPSQLRWRVGAAAGEMPWKVTLRGGGALHDVSMELVSENGQSIHFMVSTSPIGDKHGRVHGVLVSFDDVTALDEANRSLRGLVQELESSKQEIARQNEELKRIASRDPLTGCLNRRAFFDEVEALLSVTRVKGTPLSCIMCDIDHFKSFNDRFGHSVGDQVIQVVARALQTSVRAEDLICRYGGEEFCIVLPGMDNRQASATAERLRTKIAEHAGASLRTTETLVVTCSFGLSELAAGTTDFVALIDQADAALYYSKQSGRNRVTRFDEMASDSQTAQRPSKLAAVK